MPLHDNHDDGTPRDLFARPRAGWEDVLRVGNDERRTGIGGSDLADVLGEDHGCPRRLVYQKRNVTPDYPHPEETERLFDRGHALEPLIAERYQAETGKMVRRRSLARHTLYPWAMAHVDREILGDPRGVGILEAKSHNGFVVKRIAVEGVPAAHILQMVWYLWIVQRTWGAFAILDPDSWRFLTFEVTRDDALVEAILPRVEALWKAVEHGPLPDPLDPKDKRCQRCPWRKTCHGGLLDGALPKEDRGVVLAEDDSLAPLVADLQDAQALLEDAESTVDAIKGRLKATLGDREAVRAGGYKLYYRQQVQERIDTAGLRAKYPAIAKECTKPVPMRALRVYGG